MPEAAVRWKRLDGPPSDSTDKAIEKIDLPDDAGVIDWPDAVPAIEVKKALEEGGAQPASLGSGAYRYFRLNIPVSLEKLEIPTVWIVGSNKGITLFRTKIRLVDEAAAADVQIEDVGPDTEWVEKPYELNAEAKIGYGLVNDVLKLFGVTKALPVPEGEVTWKYAWKPKYAKVIAGASGREANWTFGKVKEEPLDGQLELVLSMRTRPEPPPTVLRVERAEAVHDFKAAENRLVQEEPLEIPIEF